jgi:hypothetical protein
MNPRLQRYTVFASILIAGVIVAYFHSLKPPALRLPDRFGGLALAYVVDGERANAFLNRMHDKEVTPSRNLIGMYASSMAGAVLYLSEYGTEKEAAKAFQTMAQRIASGNPVFSGYRIQQMGVMQVAYCYGQGQDHYFFAHDNGLYWLAADAGVSRQALLDLLGRF